MFFMQNHPQTMSKGFRNEWLIRFKSGVDSIILPWKFSHWPYNCLSFTVSKERSMAAFCDHVRFDMIAALDQPWWGFRFPGGAASFPDSHSRWRWRVRIGLMDPDSRCRGCFSSFPRLSADSSCKARHLSPRSTDKAGKTQIQIYQQNLVTTRQLH